MMMQTTVPPVRKTVMVKQPVDQAFAWFTARIDQWWPRSQPLASELGGGAGTVVLEPRPQGQIYRRRPDGTIDWWGEVNAWEPPHRLVLRWQPGASGPAPAGTAAATEIEDRFTPVGAETRVDLEHRGWEQLGGQGAAQREDYESTWGHVLAQYAGSGQDNGAAVASLILGIASVVLPLLGLLAAPFAIIFGITGRRRARHGVRHGGLATAGLTLGCIGLVLWGLLFAGGAIAVYNNSDGNDQPVPVQSSQPGR